MAVVVNRISLDSKDAQFRTSVTVQDTPFNFGFFFNNRMNRWIMSVYDEDNNPIVEGINVLINQDFLIPYKTRFPAINDLTLFFSSTNVYEQSQATRNSLGDTVVFLYSQVV